MAARHGRARWNPDCTLLAGEQATEPRSAALSWCPRADCLTGTTLTLAAPHFRPRSAESGPVGGASGSPRIPGPSGARCSRLTGILRLADRDEESVIIDSVVGMMGPTPGAEGVPEELARVDALG